jgi:hypothetical protein
MAKFDMEQAAAVAALKQLVSEWAYEVDMNAGLSIEEADVLTKDCRCNLLDQWIEGRDAVAKFYKDVHAKAQAGDGSPVIRQLVTNFRVYFDSATEAKVEFNLLLFMKIGTVPFSDYCEPIEVADVHMECRLEADGHWRISKSIGDRIFRRD